MAKISNTQTFTFIDEKGNTHTVVCYTTHTNIRTTEHAECDGYHGKDYWYNRPWYRFTYENALLDLAGKMANGDKARYKAFKACIDAKAQSEKEACEAWFKAFKADYDSLSDDTKKHLANSGVVVTSVEQANDVMKISKAFDAMNRLLSDDKN